MCEHFVDGQSQIKLVSCEHDDDMLLIVLGCHVCDFEQDLPVVEA